MKDIEKTAVAVQETTHRETQADHVLEKAKKATFLLTRYFTERQKENA